MLEVTEDAVMVEPARTSLIIQNLRAMGVEISLDDFGIGQSSLSHLKWLPLDEVKIDRSFVILMREDPKDATIVEAAIDLGHAMGLRVVGEGVEDAEALERLREFGCDLAQGYHLSRPMPADELGRFLSAQAPVGALGVSRPATNSRPFVARSLAGSSAAHRAQGELGRARPRRRGSSRAGWSRPARSPGSPRPRSCSPGSET